MDRPLFNKAARQLEFILGHNLFINNVDWQVWLVWIRHHLSYPFHIYCPHFVPQFDAILDGLLYYAISASSPAILSSAVDVPSPLRAEQQERFLLFLICGILGPEARSSPYVELDCPGHDAKLVVGNDAPVMEWDEEFSPPMEELQRDFPPGVEYVEEEEGEESRWVPYEVEKEVMVQVPFAWAPATLGDFQRDGLVAEDEYGGDCYAGDAENQGYVDMEMDEHYDDENEDVILYKVDIAQYHAAYPLASLSTVLDGEYTPAQFAGDMDISRQLGHLIYGDYRDDGVRQDTEYYDEAEAVYQEDEEYSINNSPYLPRPIEWMPLGQFY
jgi:hypothetical protein